MIHLPGNEIQFWLDINVRLAEFCNLRLSDQNHAKRLFKILKASEQAWYKILKKELETDEEDLYSILLTQYNQNKTLFCRIFALKKFSDSIGNIDLIINKARFVLNQEYPQYEALSAEDKRALILPIFLHDTTNSIFDLFCDNTMKKSTTKTFYSLSVTHSVNLSQITVERIQKIIDAYQRRKRGEKRKIHVMWVMSEESKIKIIFRMDKRSTTVIKKTIHNEAIKTADQKIFVFTENGSKLSVYLGREPKKTLEIAQFLAGRLFGLTLAYNEDIIKKPVIVLDRFINAIQQANDQRVKLLAITVLNAPLTNSPMIEIRSLGSGLINENISELNSHALHLISNRSDLTIVTLLIQNQRYRLHFEINGDDVIIKCSDKGYNAEKKRIIENYFDSFNTDDNNASSH